MSSDDDDDDDNEQRQLVNDADTLPGYNANQHKSS